MINVVVFNGGRGAANLIPELINHYKDYKVQSIVNAYDDGKSTGQIREFFEMLGPSDIRKVQQLMLSKNLSDYESINKIFDLRFPVHYSNASIIKILRNESTKRGANFFGNFFNDKELLKKLRHLLKLFLINYDLIKKVSPSKKLSFKDCSLMNCLYAAAYISNNRNIDHAAKEFEKIFNLSGSVLPSSLENKKLVGLRSDGTILFSEAQIVELRSNVSIERVFLLDSYPSKNGFKQATIKQKKDFLESHHSYVEATPRVLRAIKDADIIIYSAGTQHSSLYPTYFSNGVATSIVENKRALKVFIANIGADYETPFYKAHDYILGALKYLNLGASFNFEAKDYFDIALINNSKKRDKSYVKIDSKRLQTIPVKTVIKKFELNYSGKHDGSKIAKFIHDTFTQSHGK